MARTRKHQEDSVAESNVNLLVDDIDDDLDDDDDVETDEERAEREAEEAEREKSKREKVDLEALDPNTRVQTGISMPAGLKLLISKDADEKDVSISTFIRDLLADRYSYVVPRTVRTRKPTYATEEERTAARKRSIDKRNNMMKLLLARYKDDPAVKAEIDAQMASLASSNGDAPSE